MCVIFEANHDVGLTILDPLDLGTTRVSLPPIFGVLLVTSGFDCVNQLSNFHLLNLFHDTLHVLAYHLLHEVLKV